MGRTGTVEISRVRSTPEGVPLEFDIRLENSKLDSARPPTIEISMRNSSNSPGVFQTGRFKVFGSIHSENRDPGLLLLPASWEVRTARPFRPIEDYAVSDSVLRKTRIDAGKTVRTRRTLWDHPMNEGGVFEPGVYTFVNEFTSDNDGTTFEWGFTVTVN